jgi:DNA-binding NtrC family response regulator
VDTAVEALRQGACDYLTKPVDLVRLKILLANLAHAHHLRYEIRELRGALPHSRCYWSSNAAG